jgi:triphosphoribosyl-dephospho-CoA synthase
MIYDLYGQLAVKSLLYEVSTSPKPGLVDRFNSGSHEDMEFYTFMASGASLSKGFHQLAAMGYEWADKPLSGLLTDIRPVGIQMETQMFEATGGINTHKGMIFSLGLISFAAARIAHKRGAENVRAEEMFEIVSELTQGICNNELKNTSALNTHGERVYKRFGALGIRGEVESGFPTLLKSALDEVRNGCYTYINRDAFFLQILFEIMKHCEDSTILHRHNPEMLTKVQLRAESFLNQGGMKQSDAFDQVFQMDKDFISKRISPGGSADLLAVAIMTGLIEGSIK